KNDEHFRPDADPEPNDDQRNHGDARDRIEGTDKRVQQHFDPAIPADDDSQDHADHQSHGKPKHKVQTAIAHVAAQAAVDQLVAEALNDSGRAGEEQGRDLAG